MLLRVKTPKTGAIIIFGIVFGVVLFAMGSGWPIFVCSVVGAAIAELIARTSSYKSYTMTGSNDRTISKSEIAFEHVSFSYGKETVLNDVSEICPRTY